MFEIQLKLLIYKISFLSSFLKIAKNHKKLQFIVKASLKYMN